MSEHTKDFGSYSVSVKFVEPQQDTINYTRELTDQELDSFMRRKSDNIIVGNFKDTPIQRSPLPHQRRNNNDLDTQGNYNREFTQHKYVDMNLPSDDITLRIQIVTDMKL